MLFLCAVIIAGIVLMPRASFETSLVCAGVRTTLGACNITCTITASCESDVTSRVFVTHSVHAALYDTIRTHACSEPEHRTFMVPLRNATYVIYAALNTSTGVGAARRAMQC